MMYAVADIHGNIRLNWLKTALSSINLVDGDYLLILGDAGIIWGEDDHSVQDYYSTLPCTVLFVDGNHENFSLLNSYPVVEMFGGSTHQISNNIYHLMRGEVFSIGKKCFFAFGGGFSRKKLSGSSSVTVWDEEMPNNYEYENGLSNLISRGNDVDVIITHVAPTTVAQSIGENPISDEKDLNDYLEQISKIVKYNHWYLGHYHKDASFGRVDVLYARIVAIEV